MPYVQSPTELIVQGTAATLSCTFVDQHGEARSPGVVTVQVKHSDGTQILAAGTATTVDTDGVVHVTLTPAQTATLDLLTCTWTEASGAVITTTVDVLGSRYFSIAEARTVDRALRDTARFTDEDVLRCRDEVEAEVERITGRSFVPRFTVDTSDTSNVRRATPLQLANIDITKIRWVKVNGTAYSSFYWQPTSGGRLYFGNDVLLSSQQIANGPRVSNLPIITTVGYEFGWPAVPPDLKRAMLTRLRSRLLSGNTNIPDRATSMSVDGATYSLVTPGLRGAKTGIPEVDVVYDEYMRPDWKNGFVGSVRIV